MILIENLSKQFGNVKAVDGISFEVKEGENMILLGTSGCGKTTTLKMINRLIEPSGGVVKVNGKNIQEQAPQQLRRGIGYVLQDNGLFPHYTVAENIAVVALLLHWDKNRIEKRTLELMEKLSLPQQILNVYPDQLSGGQKQRVGLARALMTDPPVLLMDEPFGALDPVTRVSIRKEFRELDELKRKTIVMVTHDVQEAFELADRICLMDKGKIMQNGTADELLFNPANGFVMGFLKEQRLQLEFKAVTINDVWDLLTTANQSLYSGHPDNSENSGSVWEALEKLTSSDEKALAIQHNGILKNIMFTDLMSAFNVYQNRRAL